MDGEIHGRGCLPYPVKLEVETQCTARLELYLLLYIGKPNLALKEADKDKRFLAVETQTDMERTVQKAFGFSCMTGLRLGDMQHLRWSDIKDINSVQMVSIVQHKTKRLVASSVKAGGLHHLSISEEA